MWHMYLPIAGNSVNIIIIFALGGFVGLMSGIFGVGGGFLMTPLLIMFGIPPTVAAASGCHGGEEAESAVGVT